MKFDKGNQKIFLLNFFLFMQEKNKNFSIFLTKFQYRHYVQNLPICSSRLLSQLKEGGPLIHPQTAAYNQTALLL